MLSRRALLLCLMVCLILCRASQPAATSFMPKTSVQVFMYLWYGNPETDGRWIHWNHTLLEHWDRRIAAQYPSGAVYKDESDVAAASYPDRGPYSSMNEKTLLDQLTELRASHVDTVVASWWRQGDSQGTTTDKALKVLLRAASKCGMKVAFHLEPYEPRSEDDLKEDLFYLISSYGKHPAAWKSGGGLPLVYLYDSYRLEAIVWRNVLEELRRLGADALYVGLYMGRAEEGRLAASGFDAAYTYFASPATSEGSRSGNWHRIQGWCADNGLLFIPSVAPGYNDARIRPWNLGATVPRKGGQVYSENWGAAVDVLTNSGGVKEGRFDSGLRIVSITSFNEWGEGTQIEPARNEFVSRSGYAYEHYVRDGSDTADPNLYMELTRTWAARLNDTVLKDEL